MLGKRGERLLIREPEKLALDLSVIRARSPRYPRNDPRKVHSANRHNGLASRSLHVLRGA